MKEQWKPIPGYNELYEVSNLGRVRTWKNNRWGRSDKPKIMKLSVNRYGRQQVVIWKNNNLRTFRVHRLVAEAFVPNPDNKGYVNHKDGNTLNNGCNNLEWCTHKENQQHASRNGLLERGEDRYNSVFTETDVLEIRAAYRLGCFTYDEIADAYGVSKTAVSQAITKKTWAWL